jgi:transcriptional regulator with XRE-family HTH domain
MARLRIREIAEQKGIRQSHLQMEARVTPPLLNRYWHNKTDSVTLSALERIAKVLGVKMGELLVSDDEIAETKQPST